MVSFPAESRSLSFTRPMIKTAIAASLLMSSFAGAVFPSIASAQDADSITSSYAPETSLLYADVELDQDSAQWALATELIDRSGIGAFIPDDDAEMIESSISQAGAVLDGEAAFVLVDLAVDELVDLDDMTSDVTGVAADPEAVAGGDIPSGWAAVFAPSNPEGLYGVIAGELDAETTEQIEYEGYTIEFTPPVDEFSDGTAVAYVDDVVVLATDPADIEPIIDTATGALAPLSEYEEYTALREQLAPEALSTGFVNGVALLAEVEEADPDALSELPEDALAGLNAYSAFAFWADDPGFRFDVLSSPAEGVEVEPAEAFESTFANNVSDQSLSFSTGLDFGSEPAVTTLAVVFAQELVGVDPVATPVVGDPEAYADEIFAEAEGVIGFNIGTDLLDQLQGEWALAITAQDVLSPAPVVNAVFVSEAEDPETVQGPVDTITEIITAEAEEEGVTIESRDVNGSEVVVIDASESSFPLIFEYGVVDGQLLIGINEGIDEFVNGPDAALADDATFQETMGNLPSEYTGFTYVNLGQAIPIVEGFLTAFGEGMTATVDADPACGDYATQEEAQEAYDEDQFENFDLDQDFDGEACEDFFDPSAAEATPALTVAEQLNVPSFATVTFQDGDVSGVSTLLHIGE